MPLENILKLITTPKWANAHPTFDIEPEILEYATLHANFFLKRYEKDTQRHWKLSERRNAYVGLLGQKAFELTLSQFEIPYVPNDPVIDQRKTKNYDFQVPFIGKIEVKTVDFQENLTRLIVKESEWHGNEFVFAMKLLDYKPTKMQFIGYAEGEAVTRDFSYANNEFPCTLSPCYWKPLSELSSASIFFAMLKQKTQQCWEINERCH